MSDWTQDEFIAEGSHREPTRADGEAAERRWRMRAAERAVIDAAKAWTAEWKSAPSTAFSRELWLSVKRLEELEAEG